MNEQLFKVKIVQIIILLFSLCTIPFRTRIQSYYTDRQQSLRVYSTTKMVLYTKKEHTSEQRC